MSVTERAHRNYPERWWDIYRRWHGVETIILVDRVRSGASATLAPWGVGADPDIIFLRERSFDPELGEGTHWYAHDPLHVSI